MPRGNTPRIETVAERPILNMILEAIVTTCDSAGRVNVAPMGPLVPAEGTGMVLRPFRTSTTYQNLRENPCGVIHVTDDVLLLARGAIGRIDPPPELVPIPGAKAFRLADCCRWHYFEVEQLDDSRERTTLTCRLVSEGRVRDFFGLNRAMHAVVEAAILATRVEILPREELLAPLPGLQTLVEKTGGPREHEAFALLRSYIEERLS